MLGHCNYHDEWSGLSIKLKELKELKRLYNISYDFHHKEKYTEEELNELLGERFSYDPEDFIYEILNLIGD